MDVDCALDAWLDGELSIKEVLVATGYRKISDIYREIQHIRLDDLNEEELASMTGEDFEREELEELAWRHYAHWLAEEPGYLETIVRGLRRERQRRRKEIGRRLTRH
ncbi:MULTISPECIES: hypothetical protein [unclassified Ensifer]|uniref:hypothetical protein n=1 Tax=unclassified Ensifer TaxID=2633371 RepID=UPI000812E2C4|nr:MULTISPECIES: hypothetical protein [unclassified Ensifer]OCP08006.1 hypothetical protein BC362_10370 [Ensifer sp. LC14]OCP10884.1 hypothetical protein BC374_17595 [Ensifer sp. LC13]OCP11570.1 hypothetical protein BBX50_18260 [Ensifer sp. LC11]OCP33389.1 hypothetical protein BC364_17150 [Ensifer sp. LC499]